MSGIGLGMSMDGDGKWANVDIKHRLGVFVDVKHIEIYLIRV